MVAPHVDFQHCCEAAKIGLASGNRILSFPCPKCGAVYCDPVEQARKLLAQHGYVICMHKWSKYPLMQGNPLAVLRCQLLGFILFVLTLPVDNSIL